MAAKKSKSAEAPDEATFEEAISRLESIVESMEHSQLALEELVAHYEEGSKLLGRCEAVLKSARNRIELITLKNRSEIGLASDSRIDHSSGLQDSAAPPDDNDDDDDIRLF
ncbi:exodeoxyribonuclease VII small subunit [Luteolibacter pohnpeiensis]|uniref:Exodeoxyribonuclease 7 small subunit n=1 Tax=Luteolibacter pohnpeiensis TaxID=454153 RepID=A0A934VRQ9_9BACT|nr:exodeoxyribonuclease VII small subunit [Luteolibacter pohnpeiensis]MBK1883476.1 exodeoxyribonuclease VII small subunit [Luteolibacter pohnpeiensis]